MENRPGLVAGSRDHLAETSLSYFGHMRVAFGIAARLMFAAAACLLHGLIPGAFTDTASRTIRRLNAGLDARHAPQGHAVAPVRGAAEAEA